jgi:thiol-disulfide isomerase/thioredoxin
MMKKLIPFLLVAVNCLSYSQSFNTEVHKDSVIDLIGKFNEERLKKAPFDTWYVKNSENYTPKLASINVLKENLSHYTITLFMGTWCGDSKRETPRLYQILEASEFPLERLTSIAVSREKDRYKQSSGGEEEGKNIHRVPTIILYKDDVEINRIVEHPVISLEEDLVKIIQGDYQPNYRGVQFMDEQFQQLGLKGVDAKRHKIQKKLKNLVTRFSELNTYSHVLEAAEKTEEALWVARINLALFPEEPLAYANVGQKFQALGEYMEAELYFTKALVLAPTNKDLQKWIDELKQNQ